MLLISFFPQTDILYSFILLKGTEPNRIDKIIKAFDKIIEMAGDDDVILSLLEQSLEQMTLNYVSKDEST